MSPDQTPPARRRRASMLAPFDYRLLLGLLTFAVACLIAMWLASRDFLPGARMFPYFITAAGVVIAGIAILRVWLGHEPAAGPGQALPDDDDVAIRTHRKAAWMLLGIAAYFLGIALIGFLVSTGIFLVVFSRLYKQSLTYTAILVAVCLTAAYVLSQIFGLYLPKGWLLESFY